MVLRKGKKLRTNQTNKIVKIWLLWTNKYWSQDGYKKYTYASSNRVLSIDFLLKAMVLILNRMEIMKI